VIRGRKLVVRIYLIGLAQIAALALTLATAAQATRPQSVPHGEETWFLMDELASKAADRTALEARLRELKQRTGIDVELRDRTGAFVAASGPVRTHGPGTLRRTTALWRSRARSARGRWRASACHSRTLRSAEDESPLSSDREQRTGRPGDVRRG
jgi:hypothetical protein